MSTTTPRLWIGNTNWVWIGCGGLGVFLLCAAVFMPSLNRARPSPNTAPHGQSASAGLADQEAPVNRLLLAADSKALTGGAAAAPNAGSNSSALDARKIVRSTSMELTVNSPAQAAQDIRRLAEGLGGYLEVMQVDSSKDAPSACVTIRVPAVRFEDAKAKIRAFATQVENEKTDARDVTKEYVDTEARIRNLRAEEAQYLQIMKSAGKVEDMLDVSEKLSEVRGEIEQQQAEFEALSKQVEMSAITVSAHTQPAPEAFGINWQPLHQLRLAERDALNGLAEYATSMISVILYLPVILLWMGTVIVGIVTAWKLLHFINCTYFTKRIEAAKPVQS